MDVLGLLLAPARLTLRALDDLHAVAAGISGLGDSADRLSESADRLRLSADQLRATADRLDRTGQTIHGGGQDVLEVAKQLRDGEAELLEVARRLATRADEAEDTVEPIARLAAKMPGNRR